jgi:MerR family transcriptional regulator/heat shock protein HspR
MMRTAADEPVYVISVAARLSGLLSWELRVLDQEGIVVPGRTESNRRLYSDNDIEVLRRVRYLMQSPPEGRGVNIAGVKVILEMEAANKQADQASGNGHGSSRVPLDAEEPLPLEQGN